MVHDVRAADIERLVFQSADALLDQPGRKETRETLVPFSRFGNDDVEAEIVVPGGLFLQFIPEDDIIGMRATVEEMNAKVKPAIDRRPDHAHEGCDPASSGKEDEILSVEERIVAELARGRRSDEDVTR